MNLSALTKAVLPTQKLRFLRQRILRGWDDSETWSLDHSLSKSIVPRLRRFREISCAHPSDLTSEEWNECLDKMIDAFEFGASERRWFASPEEYQHHQEGLELFGKWFWALWW
jgi:hypothetical protein